MERIRELWGDWWKVIGIIVLIGIVIWLVASCRGSEKDRFLTCVDDAVTANSRELYYADIHHDAVDTYLIHDFVEKCYDDRTIDPDAERPDYR